LALNKFDCEFAINTMLKKIMVNMCFNEIVIKFSFSLANIQFIK